MCSLVTSPFLHDFLQSNADRLIEVFTLLNYPHVTWLLDGGASMFVLKCNYNSTS